MNTFVITPTVDETREFIEIASDFSNPLDLVREAISNAFDANATRIEVLFSTLEEYGETTSLITIRDNGDGMNREGLQAFFDLGNSPRRGDPNSIGEKGHGTKVYFNSRSIEVTTTQDGVTLHAVMAQPFRKLHDGVIPKVEASETRSSSPDETEVLIKGYHNNRRDKFTHGILKDYVFWFTKFGSVETVFFDSVRSLVKLRLKGLDRAQPEILDFGHHFPEESPSVQQLFDQHLVRAPDHYCKRVVRTGHLKNFPDIAYDAVFSIEGTKVKYSYNPMVRRRGLQAPRGAYTVQERYGLWLCKDFIPIQRKNEWVTYRGSEFTRLHAFFNCQALKLTANRGSVDNTPSEIMQDIRDEVKAIYGEIVESDDWRDIEWLEEEAQAYKTVEKEKKDFSWRIEKAYKTNVATYGEHTLIEPRRESGVFALLIQLSLLSPGLFPFQIIDYDTHSGLDVIVKGDDSIPIHQSKLYYVELKYFLTSNFNHSFENLHSIVCWDTEIKHGDIVEDIAKEERKMHIAQPGNPREHTRYFLDHPRRAHKIEVYVLKDYLKEKLGLEFRPRGTVNPS